MTSPFERLAELAAAGRRFAVATVVRTDGSTPQTVGAKLIVTDDRHERPFGTLGGGCVEADAMLALEDVLRGKSATLRAYQLNEDLAWNTGLVCGGTMWILAETGQAALETDGHARLAELQSAISGATPLAFVTQFARNGRDLTFCQRVTVLADGRMLGTLGTSALDRQARDAALAHIERGPAGRVVLESGDEWLIEPVVSRPRLIVAGGGHVAKAIARQSQLLDFDVTILEDRPEFADPARFGGAAVIAGPIAVNLATLDMPPQSFIVIATRGHKLDADCVLAAASTNARYIGLLGSRRKTVLVEELLRERGIAENRISAIRAPVGLDLGGRTPAEIALAVLAEITQVRYGGTGTPLSQR